MRYSRRDFPHDFIFGTAAASYQIEGACQEGGRSESIWDRFCDQPGRIMDGSSGKVACDHYHRFREDFALMRELGVDSYRLSLAWCRIIPDGTGAVNEAGIAFYLELMDALLEEGITPVITLYHWDLPQILEDMGGWSSRNTAYAFAEYADVCFRSFGDRCSRWITLNEPLCTSLFGYGTGSHAPGIRDSGKMYRAIHHLNLGHGLALEKFRSGGYRGKIGTTLNLARIQPASESPEDLQAADKATDFGSRMFLHPLIGKGYPKRHLALHPDISMPIEPGDMDIIAGKIDFLGVNYYFEQVAAFDSDAEDQVRIIGRELPRTAMGWEINPEGLQRLLAWVHQECGELPLYVTENGSAWFDEVVTDGNGMKRVNDRERIAYLDDHLAACLRSIEEGIPLKGYYVWSFIDNFEWAYGFSRRFGLIYCDYVTLKRIPKESYFAYRDFLHNRNN